MEMEDWGLMIEVPIALGRKLGIGLQRGVSHKYI